MKRISQIIIVTVFLTFLNTSFAQQSAYYDALYIRENCFDDISGIFKNESDLYAVLKKYYPSGVTLSETELMKNPFFKPYTPISIAQWARGSSNFIDKSISGIGNTNVTSFVDGLARFLVERSKEEMNVAFFRKFKEFLASYPEVKTIFPTTSEFIGVINSYQYAAMLPALRSAFQKDLNAYTTNLLNLRNLTVADCNGDANCAARIGGLSTFLATPAGRSILGALIVADNLVKGNNAAELIDNLANDNIFTNYPDENLSNILQFTNLLSSSLRSNKDGEIWVGKKEINDLIKDQDAFKIYLGLIYALDQKNTTTTGHHIQVIIPSAGGSITFTLQEILDKLAADWSGLSPGFITNFKKIADAATAISINASNIAEAKKQGEQGSILVYADYAASVSDFLKISLEFLQKNTTLASIITALNNDTKQFKEVIDSAVNSCYDIKSQNYSALVLHTSSLLSAIFTTGYTFKDNYIKYGTFMANIVEAKNSDEVKTAIEAAVLPVGSSSIKRETAFNIALNAYIGAYAGYEYLPALSSNKTAFSAGLTAPVGVAFSWGDKFRCPKKENSGGKSLTLFLSLIDVGAVAAYRFNDDQTNIASDIQLKNIVSPGLFIYYGFGKCPVSIGAGAQIGPQLRKISESATAVTETDNIYIRYGLSVVVDIPLLNLYTKSK